MNSITLKPALILVLSSLFVFTSCDFKKSDPISLADKLNPGSIGLGNGNGGDVDPNEPIIRPEEQLITFDYLKKTAFVSCKDCHSKTNNEAKKPLLITAGHYRGRLLDVSTEISNGSMPPTEDTEYKLLNVCELSMLKVWIEQGTPDSTEIKVYDIEACRPAGTPPPVEPPPVVNPPPVEPPPVVEQFVTFEHLQKTALVSCKDCHSKTNNPKKKPLLITIEDFKARLDDVATEIGNDSMPPTEDGEYTSLTDCDRAMLDAWVAAGTPAETTVKVIDLEACRAPVDPPPVVNPPVTEATITFELLLKTSLVSCAECHSKTKNPVKKPLLTNLDEYKARLDDVNEAVHSGEMPVTDFGAKTLTSCEKAMVNKWVELGAPEDTGFNISALEQCKKTAEGPADVSGTTTEIQLTLQQTLLNMIQKNEAVDPAFQLEDQLVTFDYLLTTSFVSCAECHSKTKNPKKKPLLTNMDEYIARIDDVKHAVMIDDMPSTDDGAVALTACEKAMMNTWIDAGTPAVTTVKVLEIAECKPN